jgi:hypothetical protein
MISVLRGFMVSDGGTNRPLPSLILLGIVDFVCILMAAESYRDRQFVAGTVWLVAGIASSLVGYYWPQIRQTLSPGVHRTTQPTSEVRDESEKTEKKVEKEERIVVNPEVTPEYLVGLFKEHTSVQADKLATTYIGKWIELSGPLGDVFPRGYVGDGKYTSLVLFADRGIGLDKIYVAMQFDDRWLDRLAVLPRGTKIKILGQIERINKVEIRLDNCELAGDAEK